MNVSARPRRLLREEILSIHCDLELVISLLCLVSPSVNWGEACPHPVTASPFILMQAVRELTDGVSPPEASLLSLLYSLYSSNVY